MAFFKLQLFAAHSLAPKKYAECAYEVLNSWRFPPNVFDEFEPIRKPWKQESDFVSLWTRQAKRFFGQIVIHRKVSPSYYADVLFQYGPPRVEDGKLPYHGFSAYRFPESVFSDECQKSLIELADRLFLGLEMDYGFLCLDEEYESKNIVKNFVHFDGSVEPRRAVGMQWPRCIPGLYWNNYFGEGYLNEGFAEALLHRDSHQVVRLPSGIRVLSNPDPRFFATADANAEEQTLKELLGDRWFYKNDWRSEYDSLETLPTELALPPAAS